MGWTPGWADEPYPPDKVDFGKPGPFGQCARVLFSINPNARSGEAWKTWRHEGIGPSDAASILGENPWETREALLARKVLRAGEPGSEKEVTPAMETGRKAQWAARRAYRAEHGLPDTGFSANFERPIKSSPEAGPSGNLVASVGVFKESPGGKPSTHLAHLAQIYCGEAAAQKAAAKNKLPKPYWAEAQTILSVTNAKKITVRIVDPSGKSRKPADFTVWAAGGFQADLESEAAAFLKEVAALREAKAAKAAAKGRAASVRAAIAAIKGSGPRLDYQTYKSLVPSLVAPNGQPTPKGLEILALAA